MCLVGLWSILHCITSSQGQPKIKHFCGQVRGKKKLFTEPHKITTQIKSLFRTLKDDTLEKASLEKDRKLPKASEQKQRQ